MVDPRQVFHLNNAKKVQSFVQALYLPRRGVRDGSPATRFLRLVKMPNLMQRMAGTMTTKMMTAATMSPTAAGERPVATVVQEIV
jgi:hypothetical protein